MKSRMILILTAAISLLTFGLVLAPSASAAQSYGWSWMDGSTATSRTFASSAYAQDGLYVIVEVVPVYPRHTAVLEYYEGGRWVVESRGTTSDIDGQIALAFDPTCNGTWCDGTWNYRLRILRAGGERGATLRLQVTYVNDGGSTGTSTYDTYLYDRTPLASSSGARVFESGRVTINGTTWDQGLYLYIYAMTEEAWVTYDVRGCTRLTALVGLDDASLNRALPVTLTFYGSRGMIGQYALSNGPAQAISLPISGTDTLRIVATNSSARLAQGLYAWPSLAEPVVTCAS